MYLQCGELNGCEALQGWPVFQVYRMPSRFFYLHQARHQQMLDANPWLLPGAPLNPPFFFKEGTGEIFSGVEIRKDYRFYTKSLYQIFLFLFGQTSGLPILGYTHRSFDNK